jgi:hypothetical protein
LELGKDYYISQGKLGVKKERESNKKGHSASITLSLG